jgi:hypothetical protein
VSTALPEPGTGGPTPPAGPHEGRGPQEGQPPPGAPTTRTAAGAGGAAAQALGDPAPVPAGGWRDRVRSKPGLGQLYRVGVFLAGLVCIAFGLVLSIFPGPLTIPPVLLGLWIWSTEFRWARRMFEAFQRKARDAWAHAKEHPVSSAIITVGGLAAAGGVIWAVQRFDLVGRARELVGL